MLTGCGLQQMLPTGPALPAAELAAYENAATPAITYTGAPRVSFPVIPLQLFGVVYDLDVVLVSQHPDWDMHEYARIDTATGAIWLAKDSDAAGVQSIVADLQDITGALPEVPVPRYARPVEVSDGSHGRWIDVRLAYTNPAGEAVEARYAGRLPRRAPPKRSGNTMGHSRQAVSAALDIARLGWNGRGAITIDGEDVPLARLLGVPQRFALQQTQGGVAIASFRQTARAEGFQLTRPASPTETWPTASEETWRVDSGEVTHEGALSQFVYSFTEGGLRRATVTQVGRDGPVTDLWCSPALPDLTRPFSGEISARFRLDIRDQRGQGSGTITAAWTDADTVTVRFLPDSPEWLAARPMKTVIHYEEGGVRVHTTRVEP